MGQGLNGLPQAMTWSLLYASIRTRATQFPIEALETMVILGENEIALRYAGLIIDTKRRTDAYLRLTSDFQVQGQEISAPPCSSGSSGHGGGH